MKHTSCTEYLLRTRRLHKRHTALRTRHLIPPFLSRTRLPASPASNGFYHLVKGVPVRQIRVITGYAETYPDYAVFGHQSAQTGEEADGLSQANAAQPCHI